MGPYASVTLVAKVGENLGKWGSSGYPILPFEYSGGLGYQNHRSANVTYSSVFGSLHR